MKSIAHKQKPREEEIEWSKFILRLKLSGITTKFDSEAYNNTLLNGTWHVGEFPDMTFSISYYFFGQCLCNLEPTLELDSI